MAQDILDRYLPIIKKRYPYVSKDTIVFYDDGHDHYVFVVDDIHAFRFPRTEMHGVHDHVANVFSSEFSKVSPVKVQVITGHIDEGIRYQTYEFIPGIRLSRELAVTLAEEELLLIARDMGKFLTALHSFSVSKAKEINMDSLISAQDYGQYLSPYLKGRQVIFPLLAEKEQLWIEKLVIDFVALTEQHPFKFTVTHSDMLPEHFIIDEKTHKLNGVIDLAGRIADPANDFKFFDRYGERFLKTVYENYPPVDEFFDKRRAFYAGNLPVANLYQSIERNDGKMIDIHLRQLKEYIQSHES